MHAALRLPAALLAACCLAAPAAAATCARSSVMYVDNPRFASPPPAELRRILDTASREFQRLLGACVEFDSFRTEPIDTVFARLDERQRNAIDALIVKHPAEADAAALARALADDLRASSGTVAQWAAYANRTGALRFEGEPTVEDFAARLVRHHIDVLAAYRRALAADGRPVIDANPYNEFIYWLMLPKTTLDHDLYLTNQPIVSLERNSPSMHTALRGGISNGLTTPCAACRHRTAAIVSLYATHADDALLARLRVEPPYSAAERVRFAALMIAHELGHQLLHLGHPYELEDCVMTPVEGLNFRHRARLLAEGACAERRSPELRPGAAGFRDLPVPLRPRS